MPSLRRCTRALFGPGLACAVAVVLLVLPAVVVVGQPSPQDASAYHAPLGTITVGPSLAPKPLTTFSQLKMQLLIADMTQRWRSLDANCVPQAPFALLYLYMTQASLDLMRGGYFDDANTLTDVILNFAGYYKQNFDRWFCRTRDRFAVSRTIAQAQHLQCDSDSSLRESPSQPWITAFEYWATNTSSTLENLLNGVNAHINHDLALVVESLGTPSGYMDYTRVNDVLNYVIVPAENDLAARYDPTQNSTIMPLLNPAVLTALYGARQHAWDNGLTLQAAALNPIARAAAYQTVLVVASTGALAMQQHNAPSFAETETAKQAYCQAHHT